MDLLKSLVKSVTHDYFLRRDGYSLKPHRNALTASQYMSAEGLEALQLERVSRLLEFVYYHNAFYKKRFQNCGFEPGDLRRLADLDKLPILTKDDIRNELGHTFSDGFTKDNSVYNRTGGSTGVPLQTYMDYAAVSFKKAAAERHDSWAHRIAGDRLAVVWGDTDKPQPLKTRIRNNLTERAFYLDTLKFDGEHIVTFCDQIRHNRPPVMMGHAHSIFRLAEYVRDHGIEGIKFEGVITTAMVLSESERKTIEKVFQSPVFNRYGCEELSIIGSECEAHAGMHICAEGLYVELEGDNPTLPRKLIITDLVNMAMPLIRYEIGDYGIMAEGACPCGRHLPRLKEVSGRTADFLYRPDKVPVFGISILDTFSIHIPGFKQMQIVQDRYDFLTFHIVKDDAFTDESLNMLGRTVVEIFGDRMRYEIKFVERINLTERGKYRFSICNIPTGEST
jgi:phenylacetate-CoA ligase